MIAAVGGFLYLSRAAAEQLLDLDAMLEALARALVVDSSGVTSIPPRTAARTGEGNLLGVMAGYVPGIALESKLVSVFPANDAHGLPSHQALIAMFDEATGSPLALMDGTYITAIPTGGTAAVATRALARADAAAPPPPAAGAQGWWRPRPPPRGRDCKDVR